MARRSYEGDIAPDQGDHRGLHRVGGSVMRKATRSRYRSVLRIACRTGGAARPGRSVAGPLLAAEEERHTKLPVHHELAQKFPHGRQLVGDPGR